MDKISFKLFKSVEIRIGEIVEVNNFPEAINSAYKIKVDLGKKIGIKQSSAQLTNLYTKEELIGKQVLVVVNFHPKQIGPFLSECLITGFYREDKSVVLATSDKKVPNGTLLA